MPNITSHTYSESISPKPYEFTANAHVCEKSLPGNNIDVNNFYVFPKFERQARILRLTLVI